MPKISIITPTYNSSLFIEKTINSVLNQTFTDWEYLIIDDGSKDNTTELIQEFIKNNPRIKLLKTPYNSGGPATPKNIGIQNAKGEYIAFLDHDDEWLPEKLEKQLKVFEEKNDAELGLVSSFINIVYDNQILKHHKNYNKNLIRNLANENFIVTSSCVLVKKDALEKVELFDAGFKLLDDWDMWIKIAKAGYSFDYVPEYLVNYIIHDKNNYTNKKNRVNEFNLIYNNHTNIFQKYNLGVSGYYYYLTQNYALSRKYYLENILLKESTFIQKIKSFIFIILSFLPKSEEFFRKIYKKLKS